MRQKMITLDPTTWELAQKMPNFSAWVRKKLRDEGPSTPEAPIFYHCSMCDRVIRVTQLAPFDGYPCRNGCETLMTHLEGWTEEQVKGLIG